MNKPMMRMLAGALLAILMLINAAAAEESDGLQRATQATVRIFTGGMIAQGEFHGQCSGTGVIVSTKGLILTTLQAIAAADGGTYSELWAGLVNAGDGHLIANRALRLKVVATNKALNLALLQLVPRPDVPPRFPFIKLASVNEVTYGSPVTLIGAAVNGGLQLGRLQTVVVDIDERNGGVIVDGSLGALASGGPVVNERGELLGIQTVTQRQHQIIFFGDEDYPVGSLNTGEVGVFRPLSSIIRFLLNQALVTGEIGFVGSLTDVQIAGKVKDKKNGQPIPGAVIGIVTRRALAQDDYISANELIGYARSDFGGSFEINRPVRANRYLLKVVHPQYKTLLIELNIDANQCDLTIELIRN